MAVVNDYVNSSSVLKEVSNLRYTPAFTGSSSGIIRSPSTSDPMSRGSRLAPLHGLINHAVRP